MTQKLRVKIISKNSISDFQLYDLPQNFENQRKIVYEGKIWVANSQSYKRFIHSLLEKLRGMKI